MKKPTRTRRVITWPNGRRETLKRTRDGWRWGSATSSRLDNALDGIEARGGHVKTERIPAAQYQAEMAAYETWRAARRLRAILGGRS